MGLSCGPSDLPCYSREPLKSRQKIVAFFRKLARLQGSGTAGVRGDYMHDFQGLGFKVSELN